MAFFAGVLAGMFLSFLIGLVICLDELERATRFATGKDSE